MKNKTDFSAIDLPSKGLVQQVVWYWLERSHEEDKCMLENPREKFCLRSIFREAIYFDISTEVSHRFAGIIRTSKLIINPT